MATSGDFLLATNGDFLMAMDTRPRHSLSRSPHPRLAPSSLTRTPHDQTPKSTGGRSNLRDHHVSQSDPRTYPWTHTEAKCQTLLVQEVAVAELERLGYRVKPPRK